MPIFVSDNVDGLDRCRVGLGFKFKQFEKVITTASLWNTPFFENSVGSDCVIYLHVDTIISIELFVVT